MCYLQCLFRKGLFCRRRHHFRASQRHHSSLSCSFAVTPTNAGREGSGRNAASSSSSVPLPGRPSRLDEEEERIRCQGGGGPLFAREGRTIEGFAHYEKLLANASRSSMFTEEHVCGFNKRRNRQHVVVHKRLPLGRPDTNKIAMSGIWI